MGNVFARPTRTFYFHRNFNLTFDLPETSQDMSIDPQKADNSLDDLYLYGRVNSNQQKLLCSQFLLLQNSTASGSCSNHRRVNYVNSSSTETPSDEAQFDKIFKNAQVAIILLYTFLCLVAVIGNCCAVYVVVSRRKMRNVTNYFVVSLAVSDILLAIICIPFSFVANVLFNHWPFGAVLCPIVTYMQGAVVFQNSYTLLAMSLERYIAIMYPFLRRLGKRRCLQVVAACWMLAFITPIPTAVTSKLQANMNRRNETFYTCIEKWSSERQRFSYSMTIMVLQYFVPLAVLVYTYAKIVHIIWLKDIPAPAEMIYQNEIIRPKEKDIDPRKKVIKMMITVVGIYGVCWLPLHLITIAGDIDSSIFRHAYMRVVWITAHWLAMSSCAYNPFIYYWMNPKFRVGYISMFASLRSTFSLGYSNFNRSKHTAVATGTERKQPSLDAMLQIKNRTGNKRMGPEMHGAQTEGLPDTYCEGNRKFDTLLLVDHHGNDQIISKELDGTKRNNISEVAVNVTNYFVSRNNPAHNEKLTDVNI